MAETRANGQWSEARLECEPIEAVLDLLLQLAGRSAMYGTKEAWQECQRVRAALLRRIVQPAAGVSEDTENVEYRLVLDDEGANDWARQDVVICSANGPTAAAFCERQMEEWVREWIEDGRLANDPLPIIQRRVTTVEVVESPAARAARRSAPTRPEGANG